LLEPSVAIVIFWVVTPCGLVDGDRRFGGTYSLHGGIATQKNTIDIFTGARTSNISDILAV
jgi:hypothetical protein